MIAPDDGSKAYDYLATLYPDVVKVLQPTIKTGPASARNRAFAASTGQFITMLDADDAFAPGALEEAIELAQRSSSHISFFRTAYVDEDNGSIVRELTPRPNLSFQEFSDFQGSVHALYARRHWITYMQIASEDVLHDAQLLLAAGGVVGMTTAPYLKHLNKQSLCANTRQETFNITYRQIRDEATEPQIKSLYQAKLDMGEAFILSVQAGADHSFHSFVMRHASTRTAQVCMKTNQTVFADTAGTKAYSKHVASGNGC